MRKKANYLISSLVTVLLLLVAFVDNLKHMGIGMLVIFVVIGWRPSW